MDPPDGSRERRRPEPRAGNKSPAERAGELINCVCCAHSRAGYVSSRSPYVSLGDSLPGVSPAGEIASKRALPPGHLVRHRLVFCALVSSRVDDADAIAENPIVFVQLAINLIAGRTLQ